MKKRNVLPNEEIVSPIFLFITVISVSSLLIANILANRMIQVGYWAMDAGVLVFPITYIISDIVSEVYGYKWSRRVSWLSASVNVAAVLLITLTIKLPHPEWFNASYFEMALSNSWRIVVASIVSFICGDWIDDLIFERMRQNQPINKGFKLRAITSSTGGALIDTTIFILIAFLGTIPGREIVPMIILGVLGKIIYEILILPITERLLKEVKHHEELYAERTGL